MAEALAALADAEASPEKNQLTVPISLVRSKLLFAEPVLAGMDCDSARLSDLIKQVKDKKINQPCNQWEMLETISNVHRLSDSCFDGWATVEECNKEMIAKALKICSDQRASLQELAKLINAASKDLNAAKQYREDQSGAQKGCPKISNPFQNLRSGSTRKHPFKCKEPTGSSSGAARL